MHGIKINADKSRSEDEDENADSVSQDPPCRIRGEYHFNFLARLLHAAEIDSWPIARVIYIVPIAPRACARARERAGSRDFPSVLSEP